MATNNSTIINSIYLNGSNDFQQRIPDPTQGDISLTTQALFEPQNRKYLNEFMDVLVTRIGMTYIHASEFTNPLAAFKGSRLNYGSSIQEIAPKWIKAHSYKDDVETLLKMHRPDARVIYHSQNRRDKYPISITEQELRTAFTSEYGLNSLVASIMEVPKNSDEYDEFQIMKQLFAYYAENLGFYQYHMSGAVTDEATGKEFLKAVRTFAGRLKFPTTIYNSQKITDIPVFVKDNSELVLITTPELKATIDVDTLAGVFQLDKADIENRIVLIDEFPIVGAQAILTTEDFFVCHDTLYETSNFYNPETLTNTYYLHHWGVYSVSPFVPAILFTTEEATAPATVTVTPAKLAVTPDTANVKAGDELQLEFKLSGTVAPATDGIEVAPDSVVTNISGATDKLNTYVDQYGVLHVSEDEPAGTVITANFTSTYQNPSGATPELKVTGTYTVA